MAPRISDGLREWLTSRGDYRRVTCCCTQDGRFRGNYRRSSIHALNSRGANRPWRTHSPMCPYPYPTLPHLVSPQQTNLPDAATELKESLATYLSTLQNTTHHTLSDIIAFNEQHLPLEMPPGHCCQDFFLAANATRGTASSGYLSALSRLRTLSRDRGITFATRKYNIDVLVVPADSPRSTALSAVSGWPVATVPVGVLKNSGRPFGLAVFTSGEDGKGEERLMRVSGQWWNVCGERAVPVGF